MAPGSDRLHRPMQAQALDNGGVSILEAAYTRSAQVSMTSRPSGVEKGGCMICLRDRFFSAVPSPCMGRRRLFASISLP
jgi:hypothetical protein